MRTIEVDPCAMHLKEFNNHISPLDTASFFDRVAKCANCRIVKDSQKQENSQKEDIYV